MYSSIYQIAMNAMHKLEKFLVISTMGHDGNLKICFIFHKILEILE